PATSALYTLSLHDALPIFFGLCHKIRQLHPIERKIIFPLRPPIVDERRKQGPIVVSPPCVVFTLVPDYAFDRKTRKGGYHRIIRSEEHTSELQSRENLVCR